MNPKTAQYIENNRAEINKHAYGGDSRAMNVIRAYHLFNSAGKSAKQNASNLLDAALEKYKENPWVLGPS